MTPPGSRRARSATALVVLSLAACSPEATTVTSIPDAAADGSSDGDGPDAPPPPCVPGGTTALEPVTVACAQPAPARVGLDETNVYWTVQGGGAIVLKAPLDGGPVVPLVYDSAPAVGLAVGVRYIFYTQPTLGRVMRVPKAGGPPVQLAQVETPLFLTIDLNADVSALYWTGGTSKNGLVMRLSLVPDSLPELLMDGQARPRAIAVKDGFVYWTDLIDGALLRVPVAPDPEGGLRKATRLASGLKGPSDLALTDEFAYMPDQAGRVARVPLAGGALETVATVQGVPFGVATDGLALYWSTLGRGGIFKQRLNGDDTVSTLASEQLDPHFLAVGPVAVYWGTWGAGGAIKKIAR
jgi:hypothetical protein